MKNSSGDGSGGGYGMGRGYDGSYSGISQEAKVMALVADTAWAVATLAATDALAVAEPAPLRMPRQWCCYGGGYCDGATEECCGAAGQRWLRWRLSGEWSV